MCSICLDDFLPEVEEHNSFIDEDMEDIYKTNHPDQYIFSRQNSVLSQHAEMSYDHPNQNRLTIPGQINSRHNSIQTEVLPGPSDFHRQLSSQSDGSWTPHDLQRQLSNQSANRRLQNGILGLLACEHIFHFDCIWQWLTLKGTCPYCKHVKLLWVLMKSRQLVHSL